MIRALYKRSGLYFIGLLMSKIVSVLVFILYARHFGPTVFGSFVLFTTLIQVITFFSDFGLIQWYQKHHSDNQRLFSKVIWSRLLMLTVSIAATAIFLFYTASFSSQIGLVLLFSLVPDALLSVADGFFLSMGNTFRVSIKTGLRMGILLIPLFLFGSRFNIEIAVIWYLISGILCLAWYFPWAYVKPTSDIDIAEIFSILRSSFKYALLILASFTYSRGDSLIVRYTIGDTALGLYGGAYRYLETISLLPTALSQNLFPISAKKHIPFVTARKMIITMIMLGIVAGGSMYLLASPLIITVLGASYKPAVPILQIFSAVTLLFFLNAPLSTLIQSSDMLKKFLPYGIANTILNLVLNLFLVPMYGITAAAWVMLITEITGTAVNIWFVRKLYSK